MSKMMLDHQSLGVIFVGKSMRSNIRNEKPNAVIAVSESITQTKNSEIADSKVKQTQKELLTKGHRESG